MLTLGDSPEELERAGPFYAYGLFASEIQRCLQDPGVLEAVAKFVDELAASHDPLLEELLVVELLEEFAEDPANAARVKAAVGPRAQEMLKLVETALFGRS